MNDDEVLVVATRSTGFIEQVDSHPRKIPAFDPRSGDHYWIILCAFKVDPVAAIAGEQLMDHESLMSIQGPGCYYCEETYSTRIASRRCKGHS